ncbi:hypothetical protein MesoLjLb_64170 [Mesorhizobium sp. L-8-3]|nr:hypothetical protein MesoLjLb_64170 [Mesorhizobium sp. L-8-3]
MPLARCIAPFINPIRGQSIDTLAAKGSAETAFSWIGPTQMEDRSGDGIVLSETEYDCRTAAVAVHQWKPVDIQGGSVAT